MRWSRLVARYAPPCPPSGLPGDGALTGNSAVSTPLQTRRCQDQIIALTTLAIEARFTLRKECLDAFVELGTAEGDRLGDRPRARRTPPRSPHRRASSSPCSCSAWRPGPAAISSAISSASGMSLSGATRDWQARSLRPPPPYSAGSADHLFGAQAADRPGQRLQQPRSGSAPSLE